MIRLHTALVVALALAVALPAVAATPVLRYTTYLLVDTSDGPANVSIESRPYGSRHGDFTYRDQPSYRVIGADGSQLEDVDGALGQTSTVTVPASAGDFGLVELQPRTNYAVADLDRPYGIIATEHAPMNCVGGFERLYFFVPRGHTGGSIFLHAFSVGEAGRAVIYGPSGEVVTEVEDDFNDPLAVSFTVPEGQDDAVWSLGLLAPKREDWELDDCKVWFSSSLAGLLVPDPAWARPLSEPYTTAWTPLLDFEGGAPAQTVQWSQKVEEGGPQPSYEVGLSDENPHTGAQSLRIEMNVPEGIARQELKVFLTDLRVDELEGLRLWLYGDGSERKLVVRVRDASQEHHYFQAGKIDWTGWGEVACNYASGPVSIAGGDENKRIDGPKVSVVFQIGHAAGQPAQSVYYIDDLGVSP